MQLSSDISNSHLVFKSKLLKRNYWVYSLIILMFVLILVALPLIKIKITSQSSGIIRTMSDDNNILSLVSGRIIYQKLNNNQLVDVGDTILIIDNTVLNTELLRYEDLILDYSDRLSDLKILVNDDIDFNKLKTNVYRQIYLDFKYNYESRLLNKNQLRREYERSKLIYDKGALSEVEFVQHQDKYENSAISLDIFCQSKKSEWEQQEKEVYNQLQIFLSEKERLVEENKKYYITSPTNGYIRSNVNYEIGNFITAGQEIFKISPNDSLIVECYISSKDIGYIYENQEVKLQYDSFDYNQWGLGDAYVYQIDYNPMITDEGTYFIVRCKILSYEMSLKTGYTVKIRKGMTLRARFNITERTVWQLLYDKLDDWFNPRNI